MPPYSLALDSTAARAGAATDRRGVDAADVQNGRRRRGGEKFTVLLADDNRHDSELLQRLLGNAGLASVHCVATGEEVIQYLAGQGEFTDRAARPYPHVLLLDLTLSRGHGVEVLRWIADHAELPLCSVYVLTGTPDSELRRRAIKFGVAGYFQKPLSLAQIAWVVEDRMALVY